MTLYLVLKYLHVIGAAVLLGTGAGIAFFMLMAHLAAAPVVIAAVARIVVVADFLFTATAVIAQPVTGIWLVHETGHALGEGWIAGSLVLYVLAGLFWLPVVRMQMRMRDLAAEAVAKKEPLPLAYYGLFRLWVACGFPAFGAVLAILWLMIAKPSFTIPGLAP
jgi:uncharacterized membrane protein